MHELGIVFHVLKTVDELAKENGLEEVSEVTMEIGEVSGAVASQLEECWKWAVKRERPALQNAALVIETMPAVTVCNDCGKTYPTVDYGRICPYCRSGDTELLSGNEVSIRQITAR